MHCKECNSSNRTFHNFSRHRNRHHSGNHGEIFTMCSQGTSERCDRCDLLHRGKYEIYILIQLGSPPPPPPSHHYINYWGLLLLLHPATTILIKPGFQFSSTHFAYFRCSSHPGEVSDFLYAYRMPVGTYLFFFQKASKTPKPQAVMWSEQFKNVCVFGIIIKLINASSRIC